MLKKDVYDIVTAFRSAIINAKQNSGFCSRDRMNNFPMGCCDDSCDLLAYYLYDEYGIYTEQGNGVYRDDNPYNTTNHGWLILNGNTIIDITADQFKFCMGFSAEVYVGKENLFYKGLEEKQIYRNFDITKDERLWADYQTIKKYMM